ncbi:ArsB/NhaD family transporter [Stratiformator vulcanicus]|uniref:Citrate transporter n=1 Tax=Stratiformator vulcanicus TaxID=2527980 RepID=A0A517QX02_9PLAN|nr:ArsB/NhaD family transporter [Stratiformator vulcanicus]QDT36124.1 Citrate transporter [Stratiformator vulcanicus]
MMLYLFAAEAAATEAATSSLVGQPWVMLTFAIGMLFTYVGVAVDQLHKTVAALAGAALLVLLAIFLGLFEYEQIYKILEHDLNIFGVIVGTGILVDVIGRSGLFHLLAMRIVRATGGKASTLYFAICGLTFVFVAVLTIVPAMLILGSLVFVICRSLDYNPKPFLLSVAICANSGAIATFASGLPNIMIGTAANIPYIQFLEVSLPFAVISMLTALGLLRFAFRNEIAWTQTPEEIAALDAKIQEFDPWAMVDDRWVLVRSGIILTATVVGFASANAFGIGVDFVAMAGGTAALFFAGKSVEDTINKVNWTVILFFLGLFLVIGCVKATGALSWLAKQVVAISGGNVYLLVPLLTIFAAFASAIVDNIPVAATLIPIVQQISPEEGDDLFLKGAILEKEATDTDPESETEADADADAETENSESGDGKPPIPDEPLWWTLILACNLGGNGTPIGSISCVIALYTLKKEGGVTVGWPEFLKLGGMIMIVQIVEIIAYILTLHATGLFPSV